MDAAHPQRAVTAAIAAGCVVAFIGFGYDSTNVARLQLDLFRGDMLGAGYHMEDIAQAEALDFLRRTSVLVD